MGIQLSSSDRQLIGTVAALRADGAPATGYLFGYLKSRVEQFLRGVIDREVLEHESALMELVWTLSMSMSPKHLSEIASGTRELPGEDVQSGQSD